MEGEACRLVGATQDISQAELILIIIKNGFFEKGSFCAFNVVLLENAWFGSHQLARSQLSCLVLVLFAKVTIDFALLTIIQPN